MTIEEVKSMYNNGELYAESIQEEVQLCWKECSRENFKRTSNTLLVSNPFQDQLHLTLVPWLSVMFKRGIQDDTPVIKASKILILNLPFCGSYGHVYSEVLCELLDIENKYSKYDLVLTAHSLLLKDVFDCFSDLKLPSRLKFIRHNETYKVICSEITIKSIHPNGVTQKLEGTKKIQKLLCESKEAPKTTKQLLTYCTRNNTFTVRHGRCMNKQNEAEVISLLKKYAETHNLDFVVFNGEDKNGQKMSIYDQYKMFRNTKMLVGPHGAALANGIFLDSENMPIFVEFAHKRSYDFMHGGFFSTIGKYINIPFIVDGPMTDDHLMSIDVESFKILLESLS